MYGRNIFLFFIGALSMVRVHVIGMIGISEIVLLLCAPFLFMKNFQRMKRDGFMPFANLVLLTCLGCLIAAYYNNTPYESFIRGFATPVMLFCSFVFFYHFLNGHLQSFKWLKLGLALSVSVSFFFNGISVEDVLNNDIQSTTGPSDYLMMVILSPMFTVPLILWYKKFPWVISCAIAFFGALFMALMTSSGRSAALGALAAAALIALGKKSARAMSSIKRNFLCYFLLALVFLEAITGVYSYAAGSGILGEKSREKYFAQTGGSNSMLSILMGGRLEVFAGAYAASRQPIVGFGPWALDWNGYVDEFRQKHGLYDYAEEAKRAAYLRSIGAGDFVGLIPAHSHIIGGWLWYGIFGLLLWVYVIYLIFKFFRTATDAIPQWWYLLAAGLPGILWHIIFSPFSGRVAMGATVCALLYAIGVAKGRIVLDAESCRERRYYLP